MSIFSTSKLREVFFNYGKFDNDNVKAFIHAPFDTVQISGELYCIPRDSNAPNVSSGGVAAMLNANALAGDEFCDRDGFFYSELQPVVMGEHEMGDYQGSANDWKGCFKLGYV